MYPTDSPDDRRYPEQHINGFAQNYSITSALALCDKWLYLLAKVLQDP